MFILIWICQLLGGVMFTLAGIMKSTQPKEKLSAKMPWVNSFSAGSVKMIGILQLLGGIGMIVPWVTGIFPILTPIAAAALGLMMLFAAAYHLSKKEFKEIGINLFLFLIVAVVAYGRLMAVSV